MVPPAPFADLLSRFLFERAGVHGAIVSLDAACGEILGQHPYPPALRRALAELLAASALLASTLKFDGSLTVQMQGTGPVRLLVVECDAVLNLRATAQWSDDAAGLPPDAPLSALAGDPARSRLAITLDPKDGGPLYQGIVALEASSIATLIEHYLRASEQIDSRIVLAAHGARVRGILLQRLPGSTADDESAWQRATSRVERLGASGLLNATGSDALLTARFPEDDVRVLAARALRFRCGCSERRVANALRLIGRQEVESILAEQGAVSVTCEFCNRAYRYAAADARALFTDDVPPIAAAPGTVRH